ncbi:type II secretion system minor pseudopilin GspH [Thalassotalea sp. 1_MG-2023]|uniref:type II secretion system minor pseudopilin GspH n=1 Tax=Thalassotalea sp. 1_MG-2023 TaxID=3062680 RepID=UPI0026E41E65|nr:type II secretion system minor pseudopilin GspH [Thalassotalea sp. 1_MG-2023]MDO6425706.1 type II secretion system minor pseudopilin GspH [Thalassotalea sp. 1_MG-2023]
MLIQQRSSHIKGFTLIEILMVIVVIGFMVAAVQINFFSNKSEQQVTEEATRFAGIFNLAADFGLLNNIEIGLYVEDNSYQFLGYDGSRWTSLPNEKTFERYTLADNITMSLSFDGLAPEESTLVDRELFIPDEDQLSAMEDALDKEQKIHIPQVYLLTGGEITPFKATFATTEQSSEAFSINVIGKFYAPVTLEQQAQVRNNE